MVAACAKRNVKVVTFYTHLPNEYEYVVKAPGIPMYNEIIDRIVKLGIKVITDIEVHNYIA